MARLQPPLFSCCSPSAGVWVALGVDGYAVQGAVNMSAPSNPLLKSVVQEHGAWLANYRRMPVSFVAPLLAYLGAISTIVALRANASKLALVSSSLSIVGVITTAGFSLFPFLLPSSSHPDHSLTVWDASSSQATLTLMLFVVIVFLPIVLSYTAWAYRVFRGATSEAAIARGDDYAY